MDKLRLLRGEPYIINDFITITHPLLGDIAKYGENKYWQLITSLTGTSYDFRFQLDDMGIDYEDVTDYMTFCMVFPTLPLSETSIILGNLDCTEFNPVFNEETEDIVLTTASGIKIDAVIYELIVGYLRELHGLKRNYKKAGNKAARKFYMEEERRELEQRIKEQKEAPSMYEPLISSMVNCADFKYDYNSVWALPIYTFMDAVQRTQKIANYRNVMQGIYTGNIDAKKIPKDQLTWLTD